MTFIVFVSLHSNMKGAQWLSGKVLESRPKGDGFEPHQRHYVVVLEQDTFSWFNPGRHVPIYLKEC